MNKQNQNISLNNLGRVPTAEFYEELKKYKNVGDFEQYLQIAEKTIQNFPKYYLGYFCKADALLNLGGLPNLELAKNFALTAFSLDPNNLENLKILSKIFFELGDFENALSTIARALQQNEFSDLLLKNYAITALRLKKLDEAFSHIKQAIILNPDDAENWDILESMLPIAEQRQQVKLQLQQEISTKQPEIYLQKLLQKAKNLKINYQIIDAIKVLCEAEKYAEQFLEK